MTNYIKIKTIDSHTEGEPTRLVYEGFPDLGSGTLTEQLEILKNNHDDYRKAIMLEPRGNEILVGALLCKPQNPLATAGVIFFNNSGYLGMCGHGTIGLIISLAHLGRITYGEHLIETPVGNVNAVLHEDGSVSVHNIPAYRYRKAVSIDVPELGIITGDIAWGGNWFFLVNQKITDIGLQYIDYLTHITWNIRQTLNKENITGADGAEIDHIELFQSCDFADSQNFVLCPGKAYDRSPCGTGTSAKLACLAADNKLAPNELWKQASVIGSQFTGKYTFVDDSKTLIYPIITGNAYICGENNLLLDPNDPFVSGISITRG